MCIYKNHSSYKSIRVHRSAKVGNKSDSGRCSHVSEVFGLFISCSASGPLYKISFLPLLLSLTMILSCGVNHFLLTIQDRVPQGK